MNKSDVQLKQDIENELRWDPRVNSAQIGVSVDNGAVSLMGAVDTYAAKWAVEDATKRVGGVRDLAQDLTVKAFGPHQHSDSEIAAAAGSALAWDVWVPPTVTVKVHQGQVTLEGHVEWNYQRDSAERAVRYLKGILNVMNHIDLMPSTSSAQVKEKVEAALQRQAEAYARSIQVDSTGGTVTLTGHASSWHAIEDASGAAWAAPGVTMVIENVAVHGS